MVEGKITTVVITGNLATIGSSLTIVARDHRRGITGTTNETNEEAIVESDAIPVTTTSMIDRWPFPTTNISNNSYNPIRMLHQSTANLKAASTTPTFRKHKTSSLLF